MVLLEKLWMAKLNSIAQSGTITALNSVQFEIASAIIPKAKTKEELIKYLREKPWTPIIYENPHNWDANKIIKEIEKSGYLTLAKIVIRK